MIRIFEGLDHQRFQGWWDKAKPSVPLNWPMASGTIKIKGDRFEFDAKGQAAAIMPVGLPCESYAGPAYNIWALEDIAEFIAWLPATPEKWYFYHGIEGLTLGARDLWRAQIYSQGVKVPDTPLAWLEHGGCLPLDATAIEGFRALSSICCSGKMAEKIKTYLTRMPRIAIEEGAAGASSVPRVEPKTADRSAVSSAPAPVKQMAYAGGSTDG